MARQDVDIGIEGNDGTGDSIRESFRKVNENFRELYAVFGIGGQISFTDLSDTPNNYDGNENKIPAVRSDGSGLNLLELASDNALTGDADTIGFDFSVDGKLIVRSVSTKVSSDLSPTLGGPLDAASQGIAGISVDQDAVDNFNAVHRGPDNQITIDDLVIDKKYADRNYQAKEVAGGGLRLGDEPATSDVYTLTATGVTLGNLTIPGHGLSEAFNGAGFIFTSTGDDPFGVTTGQTYYIKVINGDSIALYETEEEAIANTGRIPLSGGSGTFTIKDAAYDENLDGNWLSNVALPRNSIVRRQGDRMTGPLNLFDHPGELVGTGLPNGPDDLQAATKLYVDNAASFTEVNLYVSTTGNDAQPFTPDGKEGRAPAYAYRTVNAAARKAEEIMIAAPPEPGPYMQTLTYADGATDSTIVTAGVAAPLVGRTNARTLIVQNKEWIAKEVTGYIDATYPDFADSYSKEICQRDVEYILDSVSLDALLGDNANYLSRWAGIRYYSNVSAQKAIGSQRTQTVAGIEYAKNLVINYVLTNTAPPVAYQDRVEQYIEPAIVPDSLADNAIEAKFDIILGIIDGPTAGVLDAPSIVDGSTVYKLNVGNGNLGFIDQADPENTDIIPGKVIRGKNSGAIGRIIDYKYEAGPRAVAVAETDEIEVQLLEPIEFEEGEEIEYGNYVRNTQISIRIESGIYEEDYPIRVPANVSVKGDEFRRVIIRPKQRVSQSRWANTFFYRDAEFDGLVLGKSSIEEISYTTQVDTNRTPGTYSIDQYSTDKLGKDAEFDVTVDSNGAISDVTVTNAGKDWQAGERIVISDEFLGNNGAADVLIEITKVPNGIQYVNPLTDAVDGYFGYHYLTKPDSLVNTGAGYENVGKWETNALTLIDNKEFIAEQVVNYIETTYPSLIGTATYSRTKFERDARRVVDALIKDFRLGGNEFSLEIQGEYLDLFFASGAISVEKTTEAIAGLEHIYTVASKLILGETPTSLYGPSGAPADPENNLDYAVDLFNGSGEPAFWTAGKIYRLGNVVKFTAAGVDRYYTPTKEHTSSNFTTDQALYWREIDGPTTVLRNLIDTVKFAYDTDYNPPLRNDEMDVFLMNDATILRNMTVQGHGGFMLVLDPEGQVLTKSPYVQTGSSFSQSINKQDFRGGLFVDAFVGNSAVRVTEKVDGSNFRLAIQSLGSQQEPQGLFVRRPETPCAFYVDGRRFQVNAVTNYDPAAGTAEIILDPSSNDGQGFTGLTSQLATGVNLDAVADFEFDEDKCARDTTYILDGIKYDTVLGTNYNSVYNGLAYQRATGSYVQGNQQAQTTTAIEYARDEVLALEAVDDSVTAETRVTSGFNEVVDIIENGTQSVSEPGDGVVDALVFGAPDVLPTADADDAKDQLINNRAFIQAEVIAYINANTPPAGYDQVKCSRDVGYIVDALTYDIYYGGNSATLTNARAYFDGSANQLPADQRTATADAFAHMTTVVQRVIQGVAITPTTGNLETQSFAAGNGTAIETDITNELMSYIETVVRDGNLNIIPDNPTYPDYSALISDNTLIAAADSIASNRTLIVHRTVQSVPSPVSITLQTAGNRSILGNDFTQINDLGYGLVAANGALSEMVSMFTYYCHASYYSKNGAEIRSLTGSSCYGEFGLVAEGADPNEIPDAVELAQDMVQPAKAFTNDVILTLTGNVILDAGDEIEQTGTEAIGTVAVATSQINGSRTVYLTDVVGAFDTTNELSITGPIAGDSTITALGANSVPVRVDSTGYRNDAESLNIYVWDMKDVPSNRSEFDLYHPARPAFARYEVANVEVATVKVGEYANVGDEPTSEISATFVAGPSATGSEAGANFNVYKTITDGYSVEISNPGTNYAVGDSFTISGADLGGATPTNDATITITEATGGLITAVEITGTIEIDATTPMFTNTVYKLNFSTGDAQFSQNGLLNEVPWGTIINYRRNQTHILSDLARPDILTIRPSTAVIFKENPTQVYRSISFLTSDSLGNELPTGTSQAGFDEGYDYIRLLISTSKAQEVVGKVYDGTSKLTGGTTKGGTAGDSIIAVQSVLDDNEVFRLNNNLRTPIANRPIGWTVDTLADEAPIITWGGKKHYVYNARGVSAVTTALDVTAATNANPVRVTFDEDINLSAGELVTFTDIVGMTELNGNSYYVSNISGNQADLYTDSGLATTLDGTGFGVFALPAPGDTSIGSVTRETIVPISEDNDYIIVQLADIDTINQTDAPGLYSSVVLGSELVTLRAGLRAGSTGDVTVNISTCRATGHDFLDIGTGGFNDSNYPNVIFGEPSEKDESQETVERGKGRVFFVSTDQNGIFRVGKFFSVDQGTGTVTFSASIALSDVDGLGFKRGVVVTEFSTDTAMTDNASDSVPTEGAVRGYVNRRLGYDVNGNPVANKLGPGVLAPNGAVPMTDDLNAAGNTITNLKAPASDSDAATKAYVDAGGAANDEIKDLRSVEYNDYDEGQLLVATGYKKLIVSAGSIVNGPFRVGDTITGTVSGATGTIVDVKLGQVGIEGNIVEVMYTPVLGEFSDGKPATGPDPDVITVLGGAEGLVVDGPVDEWANGVWDSDSDIEVTTTREITEAGDEVTDRYTLISARLKTSAIENISIANDAGIQQSKLLMNTAPSGRSNAIGITQADLGLAAFDSGIFTSYNGWVTIENGDLPLRSIQRIQDEHVLGNYSGDSSDNDVDEIPFRTVVDVGTGLMDEDFLPASLITSASDPGEALIKTGEGTYGISNVSVTGEVNSIVKTDQDGSIQVNSLILGGDSSYEVLALDTLDLVIKTPAQGEILRAVGGSGGASPTAPDIAMGGSLSIGNVDVSESVLHTFAQPGEKALGVNWIYSSFIEAYGEKGNASTGIAIGADTGKTTTGQVGIVTADTATSSSVVPFIFDSTGAVPDTDSAYDIGSATLKYANIYADLFRGTATESYYADLAENYLGDAEYEPGTVLVFGGDAEVTTTDIKGDHRVAGVVTTNPAHLMNSTLEGDHVTGIALQGRVPCKVLGTAKKGDILVTSAIPGYAIVNNSPDVGTVIGKALENKETSERGVIEVVVGKH
jgi:hypothetical protein